MLQRLDNLVTEHDFYVQNRQKEINRLRWGLLYAKDDEQRLRLYPRFYERYNSFDSDSALIVAKMWQEDALKSRNASSQMRATLSMAEALSKAGMFKEALDLTRNIDRRSLESDNLRYYYHILRSIYGFMADYSVNETQTREYQRLTDVYRDSILSVNTQCKVVWSVVRADQLNAHGRYAEAIELLTGLIARNKKEIDTNAILTYTLSEAYRLQGNTEEQERWLLYSSIADMRNGGREYVSLTSLTKLLFQKGDVSRAYTYLKVCMDDASACNASLRIVEISRIFPIISKAYQKQESRSRHQMWFFLIAISLTSCLLLVGIFYIWKQMKHLKLARKQVITANNQLEEKGRELEHTVESLTELNHLLEESAIIKEAYIARYIDQCSVYLEKMSSYRHSLYKIATTSNFRALVDKIRDTMDVEDELKTFYANFDDTFIQLFPTFVEEFNRLLTPEAQIKLKAPNQLTPELRIFALVRLGVTDSVKIAQFLRYSITTIYNYRTKMRNRAICNRDEFEERVKRIAHPVFASEV